MSPTPVPSARRRVRSPRGGTPPATEGRGTGRSYAPATEPVPRLGSLAVALIALTVYLLLCPPVSGDGDSAEFTLVLALSGVAHPTGYPLYTLLGHLFVGLVHGLGATWAYAANAWSALGGGVAIYFLHRLALALAPAAAPGASQSLTASPRGRFLLALLPVALFAFNPIWTNETALAEVYSWHVAWALGASLYFVRLVRAQASRGYWPAQRLYRHAAAWGLLCGVGGAHHATAIFVAAPLSLALLVVLGARRRLRVGLVATVLVATCVPLLAYGFILWRGTHPAPFQWPALRPGLPGFVQHITGAQYRMNLGSFAPTANQRESLLSYAYPFLFPGLLLAAYVSLRARGLAERTIEWSLTVSALIGTVYVFNYGVPDPSSYFLCPLALALAALAPGLAGLLARGGRVQRAAGLAATALGLVGVILWVPWLRAARERDAIHVAYEQIVHRLWSSIRADSAIVFWNDDMYPRLLNYRLLKHEKPGVDVWHGLLLYSRPVRARFEERYGFDPTAGIRFRPRALDTAAAIDSARREGLDSVEARVNALTSLPVIHFDPGVPEARVLPKPGSASSASSMPGARP